MENDKRKPKTKNLDDIPFQGEVKTNLWVAEGGTTVNVDFGRDISRMCLTIQEAHDFALNLLKLVQVAETNVQNHPKG